MVELREIRELKAGPSGKTKRERDTVGPSYAWVAHPWIQPTTDQKYLGKKTKF